MFQTIFYRILNDSLNIYKNRSLKSFSLKIKKEQADVKNETCVIPLLFELVIFSSEFKLLKTYGKEW